MKQTVTRCFYIDVLTLPAHFAELYSSCFSLQNTLLQKWHYNAYYWATLTLPKHKPCSVVLNVFYFAKHKSGIAMPITEPP